MGTGKRQNVASPPAQAIELQIDCRIRSVRTLNDRLLLFLSAQTEIEAEHWFMRFRFPMLELSDAR